MLFLAVRSRARTAACRTRSAARRYPARTCGRPVHRCCRFRGRSPGSPSESWSTLSVTPDCRSSSIFTYSDGNTNFRLSPFPAARYSRAAAEPAGIETSRYCRLILTVGGRDRLDFEPEPVRAERRERGPVFTVFGREVDRRGQGDGAVGVPVRPGRSDAPRPSSRRKSG